MASNKINPEDFFEVAFINKKTMKKVSTSLESKDGEEIDLPETIESLVEYISEKMESEDSNQFVDQILPMISQVAVSSLSRIIGIEPAAYVLSSDILKTGLTYSMCTAFLLLKLIQKNEMEIIVTEEDVTEEDLEKLEEIKESSQMNAVSDMFDFTPKELIKEMLTHGVISEEDLEDLL